MEETPIPPQKPEKPLIIKVLQWIHLLIPAFLFVLSVFLSRPSAWKVIFIPFTLVQFVIFYSLFRYSRSLLKLGFITNLIVFVIIVGPFMVSMSTLRTIPEIRTALSADELRFQALKAQGVSCFDCGPFDWTPAGPTRLAVILIFGLSHFELFSLFVIGQRVKNKS